MVSNLYLQSELAHLVSNQYHYKVSPTGNPHTRANYTMPVTNGYEWLQMVANGCEWLRMVAELLLNSCERFIFFNMKTIDIRLLDCIGGRSLMIFCGLRFAF